MTLLGLVYLLVILVSWFVPLYLLRKWLVNRKRYTVEKPLLFIVATYITTVVLAYMLNMAMASAVYAGSAADKAGAGIYILVFNYLLAPLLSVLIWRAIMARKKAAS